MMRFCALVAMLAAAAVGTAGEMLLQPSEHALPIMRADYLAMRQMIYGDYPSFDILLETLRAIESDVNSLAG